jgi:hypothetical protein
VKRIPIDKAVPGQILAEKLTRHDGVLLAGQGSEITEGLLRMMSRLNIETVVIEEEESRTAQEVEESFQELVVSLEARFVRVADSPVLMALKKTMLFLAQKEMDETLAHIEKSNASAEIPEAAQSTDPTGQV